MEAIRTNSVTAQPKPRYQTSRVGSIDSARGAAMLFVCLAHFANAYHFTSGADETGGYIVLVGLLASPTFVTVSGLVAGFLAMTRSQSFAQLREKLVDRGLFLLVVGHAVLALSGLATARGFGWAYRVGYITDVIGFAVILGPWLVTAVNQASRLLLAALVFAGSWTAVFFWTPSGSIGVLTKHYLISNPNPSDWTVGNFPLIPWFAVYLAGTVIGQRLGAHYSARNQPAGHRFLAKVGLGALAFAIVTKAGVLALKFALPTFAAAHPVPLFALSQYQKFPPGPVYLTLFGGAGMLLVAGILEMARRGVQPFLLNQLRQIGLASLFIYVLQFYLYAVLLRSLRLPYSSLWPLLFVASLAILALAARVWNRYEGNRFLTVGIGPYLAHRARKKREALSNGPSLGSSGLLDATLARAPAVESGRFA